MINTEIEHRSGTIDSQETAIGQKAGGRFPQGASVDGSPAGVGVCLVEDQGAGVGGVTHDQATVGENTVQCGCVDIRFNP